MSRAWRIARQGAKKFGGSVKEYFAVSLKMAWAEVKAEEENAEKEEEIALPELTGTEKQIAWASDIRIELLGYVKAHAETSDVPEKKRGVWHRYDYEMLFKVASYLVMATRGASEMVDFDFAINDIFKPADKVAYKAKSHEEKVAYYDEKREIAKAFALEAIKKAYAQMTSSASWINFFKKYDGFFA